MGWNQAISIHNLMLMLLGYLLIYSFMCIVVEEAHMLTTVPPEKKN